jgi:Zn-finger nucleic acid-binding protein
MRLIVKCPECKRQYDAAMRQPGEHFHCTCGEDLVVQAAKGHDAAVVRCSACGSTRSDDDRTCSHCGGTLTLHERDLHTVCPGCLTRISDRASFCHHCALPIVPEAVVGETTALACPACGQGTCLTGRQFASFELTVSECGTCAGLWLSASVLEVLEGNAREEVSMDEAAHVAGEHVAGKPLARRVPQQGRLYRPCPVCQKLMNRANYGRRSGVIVDRCKQHGVWFDDDELARALRWIRQGGARASAVRDEEDRRQRERLARMNRPVMGGIDESWRAEHHWPSFLEALTRFGGSFLD